LYPREYFDMVFAAFMLLMSMSLSAAFLPIFARELDRSGLLVGLVSSAWFLSRIFTEIPSGVIADRFGRYKLMVSGLALSVFGAFLCSMASIIYVLILGRALWGLGTALFFITSSTILFDLFKSSKRGRALGTYQGIEFIGSFLGAPLGGYLAIILDYRQVFLVSTILIFCSFIIVLLSKGIKRKDVKNIGESPLSSFKKCLPSLKRWNLTIVYINSFFRTFIMVGISSTILPLYLNLQLGIGVDLIGLIVSMRTIGVIIATVVSGYISDKIGRKPMIMLGFLLQSCCLYAYTLFYTFDAFFALGLAEGFSRGMILTSLLVLLSEVSPPEYRGGAIGIYRTFMDLGGFTGPILFMVVYDLLGSHPTFILATVTLLLNAALIASVREQRNSK